MKTKFTLLMIAVLFSIHSNAQWVMCNNGLDNYVWGSAVYNGNLYACGNFEHADGNVALAIAKWNGSAWSDVGGGFQQGAAGLPPQSVSPLLERLARPVTSGWPTAGRRSRSGR